MERSREVQEAAGGQWRRPLRAGLVLSLLLPLLVGGLLWYQYRQAEGASTQRAQALAQGIERQLRGRLVLVAHALDVEAGREGLRRRGHPVTRGPAVLAVPLSGVRLEGQAPGHEALARASSLQGFGLGPPVRRDGGWQVPVVRRYPNGARVRAWLDAPWLAASLEGFRLGPDDRLNLMHGDGALLARSHDNARYLGKPLRSAPLFDAPAYRGQREGRYREASVIDGVVRQMTFRRVDGLPVVIVVGTAQRAIVAPWLAFAAATIAATLVLVALWLWQLRAFRRAARQQERLTASLRTAGERLRQTQMLARLGEYEWHIASGAVSFSPEGARVLGHASSRPMTREEAMQGIHPDDVGKVSAASDVMAATGVPQDIEFRVVYPDGSVHHVLAHAATLDAGTQRLRGVVQDITELVAAREGERETRAQYQYMFEHSPLPMWVFDRDSLEFIAVNDAMLERYGYARDELIGRSILEIRPPEERARVEGSARTPGEQRDQGRVWTHLRRDGSRLRAAVHVRDIEFEGRPARLVLAEDVTERERTEQRFQLVARATTDAVWDWDMERGVTWRSENVFQLFGYAPGEFGSNLAAWGELLHPEDRQRVLDRLQQAIDGGASEWEDDYRLRRRDGSYADVHDRGFILRDADGHAVRAVGGMVDVTERQRMIEQLAYRATFDELTGLPNRQLLADRLRQALRNARRHERGVVVLFIDLDHLKLVNDSLGHSAGDALLRQVAQRLQGAVRETDTLGRFGGDEFVAVLTEQTDAAGTGRVLERIGAALAEPVEIADTHLYVTASIGVAGWPEAGEDAETLLKNADLASSQAKQQGRNRAVAYHADFDAGVRERLHLVSALRDALHREEFRLHFQPVFDRAGGVVGMEALVRWQHPQRGLLAPGHFIGVCEDSGLIVPLGRWVLREAARHHALLAGHGLGHLRIAVNVSAAQFAHDLQADVVAALHEFGLQPGALELELTESLLMADPARSIDTMNALAERGVCMAIDDFGTGYSSLAYLKQLPLDRLKIDRSFVKDLGVDEDDAEICASIIGLGHSLGLTIVAEGVETPEQLHWLQARGCDEIQGYLLGRPRPFGELLETLQAMPTERSARS